MSENKPFSTSLYHTDLVDKGRIRKIITHIYCDRTPRDAPLARDDNVSRLCKVEADVSHIPETKLARRKGADGQIYYELAIQIEAVYLSASTQYTMIYDGKRYNSVTAEYV